MVPINIPIPQPQVELARYTAICTNSEIRILLIARADYVDVKTDLPKPKAIIIKQSRSIRPHDNKPGGLDRTSCTIPDNDLDRELVLFPFPVLQYFRRWPFVEKLPVDTQSRAYSCEKTEQELSDPRNFFHDATIRLFDRSLTRADPAIGRGG
jgi:hypothetical protein